MLKKYEISNTATLLGAIAYGKDSDIIFKLGQLTDKRQIGQAVSGIKNPGDGNDIKKSLSLARKELFVKQNGARIGVPKVILIFTDKKPTSDPANIITEAKTLKDNSIKVIAVGVGSEADKDDLSDIATDQNAVFLSSDSDALASLVDSVGKATVPGMVGIVAY